MPSLHRDSLTTYILFILPLFILALLAAYNMAAKPSPPHGLNVLNRPLTLFSLSPPTGYFRTGYCHAPPSDPGNHAIAATLTEKFLDFSAARGNDLRGVPGLKGRGGKWCLCSARWREGVEAVGKVGGLGEGDVPRVSLQATDKSALRNGVTMEMLRKYAAEPEGDGGEGGGGK